MDGRQGVPLRGWRADRMVASHPRGRRLLALLASLALLAAALSYLPGTTANGAGAWSVTGSMVTPRSGHTATLLGNGQVLVAGGCGASCASAELYDPASGTWHATGSMGMPRSNHTATLLPDGTVLVAGGCCDPAQPLLYVGLTSAELYHPDTGTWTATGSMIAARGQHTATLLPNGTVLVTGGSPGGCCSGMTASELYDPATGSWRSTGSMAQGRRLHTASLLPDGTVLVAGGYSCCSTPISVQSSAEVYDPATGAWSGAGSMIEGRYNHTATVLSNGQVLVAGGGDGRTELYSAGAAPPPATPTSTLTAPAATPTRTSTPIPPTATPTPSSTPTATGGAFTNPVVNGGFEAGSLAGWTAAGVGQGGSAVVDQTAPHGGAYAALLGMPALVGDAEPDGTNCLYQNVTISGTHTLAFYHRDINAYDDSISYDWQEAYYRPYGTVGCRETGHKLFKIERDQESWQLASYTVTGPGQIYFAVHGDGGNDPSALSIDDVSIH